MLDSGQYPREVKEGTDKHDGENVGNVEEGTALESMSERKEGRQSRADMTDDELGPDVIEENCESLGVNDLSDGADWIVSQRPALDPRRGSVSRAAPSGGHSRLINKACRCGCNPGASRRMA